jgi:hypothetical protein
MAISGLDFFKTAFGHLSPALIIQRINVLKRVLAKKGKVCILDFGPIGGKTKGRSVCGSTDEGKPVKWRVSAVRVQVLDMRKALCALKS